MGMDKEISKENPFVVYNKFGIKYVKFYHKGKHYDVAIDDAKIILAGIGLFFLFVLFLAVITED